MEQEVCVCVWVHAEWQYIRDSGLIGIGFCFSPCWAQWKFLRKNEDGLACMIHLRKHNRIVKFGSPLLCVSVCVIVYIPYIVWCTLFNLVLLTHKHTLFFILHIVQSSSTTYTIHTCFVCMCVRDVCVHCSCSCPFIHMSCCCCCYCKAAYGGTKQQQKTPHHKSSCAIFSPNNNPIENHFVQRFLVSYHTTFSSSSCHFLCSTSLAFFPIPTDQPSLHC